MREPSELAFILNIQLLFCLPLIGKAIGIVSWQWKECLLCAGGPIGIVLFLGAFFGILYLPSYAIDWILNKFRKE